MSSIPPIILYWYPHSPFARRIACYLQLRGIPYKQCIQPPLMPRPDIAALGINYRRIPILSIGRDVYLDTRLILQKLESLPTNAPKLGAAEGTEQRAIERLLETLNVEKVFFWAATLLPRDLPQLKDPAFLKDRQDFASGGNIVGPQSPTTRPEALNDIRTTFELYETTLFADGREWILKTDRPSLADIEALWAIHWLNGIPGALPTDQISKKQFPKVFAWIERFDKAISAAKKRMGEVPSVSGEEATRTILESPFFEGQGGRGGQVDESEPLAQAVQLKKGDKVVVFPLDTGSTHKDLGVLWSLDSKEVVFETKADVQGSPEVRVHAPRHGFRIIPENQASHL